MKKKEVGMKNGLKLVGVEITISLVLKYENGSQWNGKKMIISFAGSRVDKHWFLVRDITLKTDRLMTLTPLNENCPINVCPPSQDILNNLFLALQHPYICPVLHLDILEYEEEFYVIVIQPINQGSLKDLIYGVIFQTIKK